MLLFGTAVVLAIGVGYVGTVVLDTWFRSENKEPVSE